LFAGDAATDGVEVQPGILRGFNGDAQIFAEERWDLDPSLLNIENYRPADR
jgi:hypothetical protein